MNFKMLLCLTPLLLLGCTTDRINSSQNIQVANHDLKILPNQRSIKEDDVTQINQFTQKYAPFFAYNSSGRAGTADTEPATGGKLILDNGGCLLLQQSDTIKIPVFPSKESEWDNNKKQMIINGVALPLGKNFITSGRQFVKYDLSKFESIANPACIGDKKLERIGINIKPLS